jgi:plasmid recombination enzyme
MKLCEKPPANTHWEIGNVVTFRPLRRGSKVFCIVKFGIKEGGEINMAHVMKLTKGALGHMLKHYERAKDQEGNYVKFGNQDINTALSGMNYNLAPKRDITQGEFIKKRCQEVYCMNRKDVNVCCSWIVTAPKDLKENDLPDFFAKTYDFLQNRYGKDNVVSAYVHMDETTPHIHFAFVPVTYDKKKERYKVSAFEVITKKDLQSFHSDLEKHINKELGYEIGILNGATKDGNKSIQELKRQSATEILQETKTEAAKIISQAQDDVNIIKGQKKVLQSEVKGLQKDLLTAKEVKQVKHTKALIGDKQVVSTSDFENLRKTAVTAEALLKEIEPARITNALTDKIIADAELKAKEIINQAEEKAKSVSENLRSMKYAKTLKHIEKVISSNPELIAAYKQAEQALQNQQLQSQNSNQKGTTHKNEYIRE